MPIQHKGARPSRSNIQMSAKTGQRTQGYHFRPAVMDKKHQTQTFNSYNNRYSRHSYLNSKNIIGTQNFNKDKAPGTAITVFDSFQPAPNPLDFMPFNDYKPINFDNQLNGLNDIKFDDVNYMLDMAVIMSKQLEDSK